MLNNNPHRTTELITELHHKSILGTNELLFDYLYVERIRAGKIKNKKKGVVLHLLFLHEEKSVRCQVPHCVCCWYWDGSLRLSSKRSVAMYLLCSCFPHV